MKKFMFISCLLIFVCGCDGDIEGQSSEVKEVRQFHNANGALVREVPYNEAGQIHGIAREWYSNGDFKLEMRYKNGKKDGPFKQSIGSGMIKEGNYKDNKLLGSVKTNNENGILIKEEIYDEKGILLKITSWYDNGQKKSETDYEDGYKTKNYVEYYENGQLKSQYDDVGEKTWYENGQQESEENNDGTWRNWYKNGQLKSERDSNKTSRYWYENGYIRRVSKTNNDGKEEFMECNENGILTSIKLLSDDKTEYISLYNRRDIQELIKEAGINENDLCKTGFLK
ncbi:hypothetical protein [uncultured Campylobacter sp.]|uniref:toxin-antitoxin system YwqK family antitoxin n=1 Tax=uncultured Campylobacter sp. TaxID=218934 RepID=UPI00260849A3|nr:hypothetical protein [uncultured Campylobacter sp.]